MSGGYTGVVREAPETAEMRRARAEVAECAKEHQRLQARAQRYAQRTGSDFRASAWTINAATGQQAISAAAQARREVDSLKLQVGALATLAHQQHLSTILGSGPAEELEIFAFPSQSPAAVAKSTVLPAVEQRAMFTQQADAVLSRDVGRALGLLNRIGQLVDVPRQLTELVDEIVRTTDTGRRGLLLVRLDRQVNGYQDLVPLLNRAERLNDAKLTAIVAQARELLERDEAAKARELILKARSLAETLEEAQDARDSAEHVLQALESVLEELGGSLVERPDVVVPSGGKLVRWPGSTRTSAIVEVVQTAQGPRVKIEPVIVVDADSRTGERGRIEAADSLAETEMCAQLPELLDRMDEIGLQLSTKAIDARRTASVKADVVAAAQSARKAQTRRKKLKERYVGHQ